MHDDTAFTEFVTFTIAGQMFGLPIARVQDVFKPARITSVPLAGAEIAGVLNLRGRIVTAIDMRSRLEVNAREDGARRWRSASKPRANRSVCWSMRSAKCSSCRMPTASPIRSISTASSPRLSAGVYRLDGQLLVVLDIDRVLDLRGEAAAA